MVKLFDFYGISKKDLWGAYGWTWDVVDFFVKVFTVPFKVIARNFRNSKQFGADEFLKIPKNTCKRLELNSVSRPHARTARALGNFGETNIHFVRIFILWVAMIRVFRISQKKMGENGEIVRFLWYFMVYRKRTYGELMGGLGTSLIFCEKY